MLRFVFSPLIRKEINAGAILVVYRMGLLIATYKVLTLLCITIVCSIGKADFPLLVSVIHPNLLLFPVFITFHVPLYHF